MFFEKDTLILSIFKSITSNIDCKIYFREKFNLEIENSLFNKEKHKNVSGIYLIINKVNNKYYLGSTTRIFRKRFSEHRSYLKSNKHKTKYLQNSYNKYGKESFIITPFIVVPKVDKMILGKFEELLLKYLKPEFNTTYDVYNPCISEKAKNELSIRSSKKYIVTYPDGGEVEISNLFKFCRENCLNHKSMYEVAAGRLCSMGDGWKARFAEEKNERKTNIRNSEWEVQSPDGKIFYTRNLSVLCSELGFKRGTLGRIFESGGTKSGKYLGWKCKLLKERSINMKTNASKQFLITFPNGEQKTIFNLKQFCKENSLVYHGMSCVSLGLYEQYKGYKCSKI
jgi:group I intron endonuclease